MYDDPPDDPIPPLDRPGVAPLWRVVALLALLGVFLLAPMVVVLLTALARSRDHLDDGGWGGPVAPQAAVGPAAPEPEEDALDPLRPAYPLEQDLRPTGTFPLPGGAEAPAGNAAPSPREEFLKEVGRAVWTDPDGDLPERVLVSADGANMAYASGDVLMAGPVGLPEAIDPNAAGLRPGVWRGGKGGAAGIGAAAPAQPRRHGDGPRAVVCGWSGNTIVWVGSGGRPRQYDVARMAATTHDVGGVEAALLLADNGLLEISPRRLAKVDGAAAHDLYSVIVAPPPGAAKAAQFVLADDPARWHSPALSPDGQRVAIVSDRGEKAGRWRVVLLTVVGNEPKPEAVSPPAARIDGVCWAPDGQSLVYARSQSPAPADHEPGTSKDACDLYQVDLATKKETRLSRGGGFTSPSLTDKGQLFFLAHRRAGAAPSVRLIEAKLEEVRKFAGGQQKRAATWADLAERVWAKAGLSEPTKIGLSADLVRKVRDLYEDEYHAVFKGEAPKTVAALDQQRREVAALDLTPQARGRLEVILGAVEALPPGVACNGAWYLKDGSPTAARGTAENPFYFACNPFRALRRGENAEKSEEPQSLAEALFRAEGRRLFLTNDPAAAKEQIDRLADADLARGTELLKLNQGDEADPILLATVRRHAGNYYLVVHVGTLLQQHGRTKALIELLKPLRDQIDKQGLAGLPRDVRLFNLIGIADLESNSPGKAVTAFQDALRCDLKYGAAYLNLAQAYEQLRQARDARLCLRRYLKLFPDGEWADDARRRLAVAGDG
jgi:tetratricopeptide (TPR) repeat protein